MNPVDPHSSPSEAIARARTSEHPRIVEGLDRYFRFKVLDFLQNRRGDAVELGRALADAIRWARGRRDEARDQHWTVLLSMVRDAAEVPSMAEEQRLLTGRAAEVLRVVTEHPDGVRPKEVRDRLGLSPQQVSNLARELEQQGLVARHGSGNRTWILPTRRGTEMIESIPPSSGDASAEDLAPALKFWPGVVAA